jgi:hypothetical protein
MTLYLFSMPILRVQPNTSKTLVILSEAKDLCTWPAVSMPPAST